MRSRVIAALIVIVALAGAASASAHVERHSFYPDHTKGSVPKYRTTGPKLVVCKSDSGKRIRKAFPQRGKRPKRPAASRGKKALRAYKKRLARYEKRNRARLTRLRLLKQCKFDHIQAAVNAAKSNYRILIMPGLYMEEPSQQVADRAPACGDLTADGRVPYDVMYRCPNVDNLIAVMGDDPNDEDRVCDQKCNLQIEGMGKVPRDVEIRGKGYGKKPGAKFVLLRGDRADGIYMRNFFTELGIDFNIYVLETNGFVIEKVVAGYAHAYSILSFTSDNGLYDHVEAYGGGDSAIYPGSGPEGHCKRYGIEVRYSDMHDSPVGLSGTAGNGWYIHHNKIHHNVTGIGLDSFTPDHPGQPQDCSKFVENEIYSNNATYLDAERTEYCRSTPVEERDPAKICPVYLSFPGVGVIVGGGNGNIFERNHFWDNWRLGIMQIYVPAILRGDPGDDHPAKQFETSNDNVYRGNFMSMRPDGTRDPNGRDFWWDEEGKGNCWEGNKTKGAGMPDTPSPLPVCPGSAIVRPPNPLKYGFLATCTQFHPTDNTDPPGCLVDGRPFFESVPEPK
jgi:hypothetical protein